jgi:acyl-CoA synthetase (AMP-forming)/AMP-acid ligase II
MNIAVWLQRTALSHPNAPAIFHGDRQLATYAEFAANAGAIAYALPELHSIRPGDRVALFMSNNVHYLPLFFGIWASGAVVVPINAKLHAREAAWIIDNAEAKLAFVDAENLEGVKRVLEGLNCALLSLDSPEFKSLTLLPSALAPVDRTNADLAWLFYTSGTTGRPKGVMLSHGNLIGMAQAYLVDVDDIDERDAVLYAAPISHGAGLYSVIHVLRASAHIVPRSSGFDAGEVLELGRHFGRISLFAVPTMVMRLVDHAEKIGEHGEGLRTIIFGGGPMYFANIDRALARFGDRFVQIYGQGETPMTITTLSREIIADRSHPRWPERAASVGRAYSAVEVRIADPSGKPLPSGQTGEILVRGDTVMQGYWNNPEATATTIRDGWLWTGDLGALDEDGFLTLKDRSKDMIISGGTNIYPREVEEALLSHPDVAEACVIGRPDTEWGEEVIAFIVPQAGHTPDAETLDRHCIERIARFKRPKHYRFTDSLPKSGYGKVLKSELRLLISRGVEGING